MRRLTLLLFVVLTALGLHAQDEFRLTPYPMTLTQNQGHLTLQPGFLVDVTGMSDEVVAEAQRFVDQINATTGLGAQLGTGEGTQVTLIVDEKKTGDTYSLVIREKDAAKLRASSTMGFYYGLVSLRKMLPANVMAGKLDTHATYTLPYCSLTDGPRFQIRSFMLDCSRHFFTTDELKRMIDVMAMYKMNTFHWHLTDDQGWRAEVKKYPRLTTVGATRSNSWNTDIYQVDGYWTGEGAYTGKQYGPYYYSQDDMRDIVAYCAERHIQVIPEIEMPGHAVAAMVAYPKYSCTPQASRSVWTNGGISADVMNVCDPATIQFCHDIIDEMCDIFPAPYFHIGGDECPTSAWEKNEMCQQYYAEHGLTNYRQIQSHFINDITGYLASKGKRTIMWNESISAGGADLDLVKQYDPIIMCWTPCWGSAAKAASLGLQSIITEYHGSWRADGQSGAGGYYINRRQSNDYGEPTGAGAGDDTVEGCYRYVPVPDGATDRERELVIGVQGTFWTEHVSSPEYLEYLALPRLMCIAEAGWTKQEKKDWNNFVQRMVLDTEILDLGGYAYGRHWMPGYVHRIYENPIHDGAIVTLKNMGTDRGRCLRDDNGQLDAQGAELTEWLLESTGKEGEFYVRSQVSGGYLYANGTNSGAAVTLSQTQRTAWTLDETTYAGYVALCHSQAPTMALNNNASNATHARLFGHANGNTSSFWSVTLVGNATTAVEPLTATAPGTVEGPMYDLQGRRVEHPTRHGIYVMNGRKVLK